MLTPIRFKERFLVVLTALNYKKKRKKFTALCTQISLKTLSILIIIIFSLDAR